MAIRTPLSEEIGIEIPFMQAGMGGIGPITLARLAAAISEAGALGTIAQPALVLEEPGISGDALSSFSPAMIFVWSPALAASSSASAAGS